ncbi:MAG TPA: ABC transporter [Ruminococcus sp.]|nr:ABC transporter [Ruminococcus sp.]
MMLKGVGISKEFLRESRGTNRFFAVQETDIALESGQMTVLMGRSGSGKSTLLNMLAGLMQPSSGRILLGDTDLYALSDKALSRLRCEQIGVIPQGQTVLHSLNVVQNVCLPYTLYGEDAHEADARALLERLGIGALCDVKPAELSGGELRRVAIARAMLRKPAVLLADEPTADLDDENTEAVLGDLKQAAQDGAAVLVVTHETGAERFADRLLRMNAGALAEVSPADYKWGLRPQTPA